MDIPGLLGIGVGALMTALSGYLFYQDNVRLRKRVAELEDKYDTLIYAMTDKSVEGAYFQGVLGHAVEMAKIKKETDDINKHDAAGPSVGTNPDRWKKRRGGGHEKT